MKKFENKFSQIKQQEPFKKIYFSARGKGRKDKREFELSSDLI